MCGKYHLRLWSKDEQEFRSKHSRQVWNKRSSVVDAKVVCDWGIVASLDADRKLKIEKVFKFDVFTSIRRFLFAPYRRFSTWIWHSADLIKTDCCTSFRRFSQTLSVFSGTLIRRFTQPYLGVFTTLFRCFLRPIRHFQMQFPLFELLTSLGEMHSSV